MSNNTPNQIFTKINELYNNAINNINEIDVISSKNTISTNSTNADEKINNIVTNFKSSLLNNESCKNDIDNIYKKYLSITNQNSLIKPSTSSGDISKLNIFILLYKMHAKNCIDKMYKKVLSCIIDDLKKKSKQSSTPHPTTPPTTTSSTTSSNLNLLQKVINEKKNVTNSQSRFVLLQIIKVLEEILPEFKVKEFKKRLSELFTNPNNGVKQENLITNFNNIIIKHFNPQTEINQRRK